MDELHKMEACLIDGRNLLQSIFIPHSHHPQSHLLILSPFPPPSIPSPSLIVSSPFPSPMRKILLLIGWYKSTHPISLGYWRVFDLDYRDEVFQHILTLLEEKDWSWKMVPLDMCYESLSELHLPFVIRHCLDCYGVPQVREEDGTVIYELIEERVCQFYAELLLRPAGKVCI